jgi:galactokinase
VAALGANDLETLGRLFDASHESQRIDYEVSIPEIDLLVQLAREEEEVYGARLTGGGFGGSVLVLARAGSARVVGRRVAEEYARRTGLQARALSLARSP